MAYSPQDQERLSRGEPTEAAASQARRRERDALAGADDDHSVSHANDARLLRDVPPHWA